MTKLQYQENHRAKKMSLFPISQSSSEAASDILEVLRVVSLTRIKSCGCDEKFDDELDIAADKLKLLWLKIMTEHLEKMLVCKILNTVLSDGEDSSDVTDGVNLDDDESKTDDLTGELVNDESNSEHDENNES